jgi:hypothetical protein
MKSEVIGIANNIHPVVIDEAGKVKVMISASEYNQYVRLKTKSILDDPDYKLKMKRKQYLFKIMEMK